MDENFRSEGFAFPNASYRAPSLISINWEAEAAANSCHFRTAAYAVIFAAME